MKQYFLANYVYVRNWRRSNLPTHFLRNLKSKHQYPFVHTVIYYCLMKRPFAPPLCPGPGPPPRSSHPAREPTGSAWPLRVQLGAGPPESTKILELFADGTSQTHVKRTYDQIPSASARLRVGAAGGAARGGCLGREGKEAAADRQ